MTMSDNFISKHIFVFPFQWKSSPNNILNVDGIRSVLEKTNKWEQYKGFSTYNNYHYFYESVRDILSIKLGPDQQSSNIDSYLCRYNGTDLTSSKYIINTKDKGCYKLLIKEVLLCIYENGIGYFLFNLVNYFYSDFDDILCINEYGRRIYPQFIDESSSNPLDAPKGSILADTIIIEGVSSDPSSPPTEDFIHYNSRNQILKKPFQLPKHITFFLGKEFLKKATLTPILDDRMFVLSLLKDSDLAGQFSIDDQYKKDVRWYKYIYIDVANTCPNQKMMCDHIRRSTYERWIGSNDSENTLFGFSRYSFVVIGGDSFFYRYILSKQFENMYLLLVLLCLLQRSYIIKFGNEITRIAQIMKDQKALSKYRKEVSKLYLDYLKFVNKVYFREITAQEQGIEMYEKLQSAMRIKEQVEDLDKEIQELNNYVETQEQSNLNRIASIFLPTALIAAVLAYVSDLHPIFTWSNKEPWHWNIPAFFDFILLSIIVLLVYIVYNRRILK